VKLCAASQGEQQESLSDVDLETAVEVRTAGSEEQIRGGASSMLARENEAVISRSALDKSRATPPGHRRASTGPRAAPSPAPERVRHLVDGSARHVGW
jgi:hypothetical protein